MKASVDGLHADKGNATVMVQLVLTLLTDLVYRSADSTQRGFSREMSQYLKERGLTPTPVSRPVPAR